MPLSRHVSSILFPLLSFPHLSFFPWRIRKITPLLTLEWSCVPRSPLREDLCPYRLQKSASRLDRGAGEGQKEKGVGKNQTYASICTVFSCTPFSAPISGGAAGKNTALFAKPQQCKSFRASSCLYVWTRVGQCTVRTAAGERKKGRYASLDIIGKKGRKWMLIFDSFFFGHVQMVPLSSHSRLCALLMCIDWAKIILQIGVRNHAGLECSHSTELDKNAIRHSDPKSSPYEKEKTERGVDATLSPRLVRIECAVHCLRTVIQRSSS